MLLENYFDKQAANDIRVKGTRIGIETILFEFIYCNRSPESIVQAYPSLTLEQVYATLTYYFHNKESIDAYLANWLEWSRRMREEQAKNPTPVMLKLRKIRAERDAMKSRSSELSKV